MDGLTQVAIVIAYVVGMGLLISTAFGILALNTGVFPIPPIGSPWRRFYFRRGPTLGDIVEAADQAGANVNVRLVPRQTFPPMGPGVLWLNDRVYTVTARVYCRCGDAAHFTAAWMTVVENVYDFWAEHDGEAHGATTPEICRKVRRKRQGG